MEALVAKSLQAKLGHLSDTLSNTIQKSVSLKDAQYNRRYRETRVLNASSCS